MKPDIAPHTVFRWEGRPGQYLNAVPARDLVGADLVAIEDREGVTPEMILASGLYEPVDWVEVAPFCGAATEDGGRCGRRVSDWGQRCWQHREESDDGTESVS